MKFSLKSLIWGALLVAVGTVVTFVMFPKPIEVESATASLGPLRVTVQEDGKTRIRERVDSTVGFSERCRRKD